MADALGDAIKYGKRVRMIDFDSHAVMDEDGAVYQAEIIISTVPWAEFQSVAGMPDELKESLQYLKYSSIQVDYREDNLKTDAHWIYVPDSKTGYHRILVRHNFSMESKGHWIETSGNRTSLNKGYSRYHYLNKYAYPLNTIRKPEIMQRLLDWSKVHGVYGLGRWGEHQHYNSDAAVEQALFLADKLA